MGVGIQSRNQIVLNYRYNGAPGEKGNAALSNCGKCQSNFSPIPSSTHYIYILSDNQRFPLNT